MCFYILTFTVNKNRLFSLYKKKIFQILENDLDTSSEPSTSGCFSNVSQKNDLEQRMEHASREIQMLHEEQNTLLSLKQKAENKLREARHIQVFKKTKYIITQFCNKFNCLGKIDGSSEKSKTKSGTTCR